MPEDTNQTHLPSTLPLVDTHETAVPKAKNLAAILFVVALVLLLIFLFFQK